jgi:hypothetical protein
MEYTHNGDVKNAESVFAAENEAVGEEKGFILCVLETRQKV